MKTTTAMGTMSGWRAKADGARPPPKRAMLARGHHTAMAYVDISDFLARSREREALAARAPEFCILTAARSGQALGTRRREIDVDARIRTLPAGRTKAARARRIPYALARSPSSNG
jgi:integrase